MEKVISDIKELLKESEMRAENAACGYDEGWYVGEANAYETVIRILEKVGC